MPCRAEGSTPDMRALEFPQKQGIIPGAFHSTAGEPLAGFRQRRLERLLEVVEPSDRDRNDEVLNKKETKGGRRG
ncbi:MAG: hypothetical protein RBR16_02000 [Syntrophus sp. (in: bacteria)]|nr:hypothetical protein [Syntrophus sp. (in: bacteria)]